MLAAVPPPSGLISWWTGDGDALDVAGEHHGALANVDFVAGMVGPAFRFDSDNDLVDIGGDYEVAGPRTIEAWVKPNSNSGYGLPILTGGVGGGGDFFGIAGTDGTAAVGQYELYVDHWNTTAYDSNLAVTPGEWNHVAMTYNGSSVTFYVNGVAGNTVNGSLYDYSIGTFDIGANRIGGTTTKPAMNGLLDEVSFYDRALTAEEIASIYAAGADGKAQEEGFAISNASSAEGNAGQTTGMTFTVRRGGDTSIAASVTWFTTTGGTATAAVDYETKSETLQFAAGERAKQVQVNIRGDDLREPRETIVVSLSDASGAPIADGLGEGVILNDDAGPLVLPSGAVSWWPAEGNAQDVVGPNHGTPQNGADYAAGIVGQAFQLDGSNDLILAPHHSSLVYADKVTIEAWIRPTSNSGAQVIFSKWNDNTSDESYIFKNNGGVLRWELSKDQNNDLADVQGNGAIPAGEWSHVAATFDGAVARVYLNGVLDGERSASGLIDDSVTDALIGAVFSGGGMAEFFGGLIDELTIYDRALGPDEISAIWEAGAEGKLLSDGLSVTDSSGPEGDPGQSNTITFRVVRPGDATAAASVQWRTRTGGSATEGVDYVAASGSLSFEAGETIESFSVEILGDNDDEGDETFLVELFAPENVVLAQAVAVGTILEDDQPVAISVNDPSVIEGDQRSRFFGAFVNSFAGPQSPQDPQGLLFGPDANSDGTSDLYVADGVGNRVLRYSGRDGRYLDALTTPGDEGWSNPRFVAVGPDGRLYVSSHSSDGASDRVLRIDLASGEYSVFVAEDPSTAGVDESGGLADLGGMAFGPDATGDGVSDLYLSSRDTNQVLLFDGGNGQFVRAFVADDSATPDIDESGGLSEPAGLVFDSQGRLYVSSGGTNAVLRYGPLGGFDRLFADDASGLRQPGSLSFGPDGHLYVVGNGNGAIFKHDGYSGLWIGKGAYVPSGLGGLAGPAPGIAFGADRLLYVTSSQTQQVLQYGPSSQAAFVVRLSKPADGMVTIPWSTEIGTAGAGDFVAISGEVVFQPGETSRAVAIATIDDLTDEAPEQFYLRLGAPTNSGSDVLTVVDALGQATILDTITTVYSSSDLSLPAGASYRPPVEVPTLSDLGFFVFLDDLLPPIVIDDSYPIFDLDLQVNVSHPRASNLNLALFIDSVGGSDVLLEMTLPGADLDGTVFDDEASLHILQGDAPYMGAYRPTLSLDWFDDGDIQGAAYLLPLDRDDRLQGYITGWSLIVQRVQSPGVSLRTVGPPVTGEDGASTSVEVVLDFPPASNVVVPVSVSSAGEAALSASSLIFTPDNWRIPQLVTVTGRPDGVIDGDMTYNVVVGPPSSDDVGYQGLPSRSVTLTNRNIDTSITIEDVVVHENDYVGISLGTFVSGAGQLPHSLAFGPGGDLFVSSLKSDEVLRLDGVTGEAKGPFVASGVGGLDSPTDLAFGPDGHLYVISQGTDAVLRYDGQTGAPLGEFVNASQIAGRFVGLQTLAFGPGGDLFVGVFGDSVLRFSGTDGSPLGDFVSAGAGGLHEPKDLAFDAQGRLYVASHLSDQVLRYDGQTGEFLDVAVDAQSSVKRPFGLAFGPDGDLFVSSRAQGIVGRYRISSGQRIDNFGWMNAPRGIAVGPDGLLYVVDVLSSEVARFGQATQAVFPIRLTAPSSLPVSVTVSVENATAIAGADFAALSTQTLTFSPGEVVRYLSIPVVSDVEAEGVELFRVVLSSPSGAVLAKDQARGLIVDQRADYASSHSPMAIPDQGAAFSTIIVPDAFSVFDVNVQVDIDHTWDSDLSLTLLGPDGQSVRLVRYQGDDGDGYIATNFDDQAPSPVAIPRLGAKTGFHAAPFPGRFRPQESLSGFNEINAQGDWTLIVSDDVSADTGVLNGWSLSFGRPLALWPPAVVVDAARPLETSERGTSATFRVSLASPPASPVVVPLASSDASEGVVYPDVLVFTAVDWNIPQTATLLGVDDFDQDGDIGYLVEIGPLASADFSYDQLDPADLPAVNNDDADVSPGGMYVWDIVYDIPAGAPARSAYVQVQVRRDENQNAAADANDPSMSGATVTVRLVEYATGKSVTLTGVTNGQGRFTSKPGGVGEGLYYAEVVGLSHPSFGWNRGLDPVTGNDHDFDDDNFPDQWYCGVAPSDISPAWSNAAQPLDVNANGVISTLDALLTIDALRRRGPGLLPEPADGHADETGYIDVNGDGYLTPIDALLVISRLRSPQRTMAAGWFVGDPAEHPSRDEALLSILAELERERAARQGGKEVGGESPASLRFRGRRSS